MPEPVFQRELIKYLPTVLRDVPEFDTLMTAWQPEIAELWERIQETLDEYFLDTATVYGVRRWEKILRITPEAQDTLAERKERIDLIRRIKLPYTIRWLRGWLAANVGAGNFDLNIDRYTIEIWLHYDKISKRIFFDVLDLLGWVRPAEMVIGITGQRESDGKIRIAGWTESTTEIAVNGARQNACGGMVVAAFPEMQTRITVGG